MSALPPVLVVDDEPRSQEALRRALDEEFEVLTAGSAAEARGVLERETVQVVLCDQRMPGMTGVEFLKEARGKWPDAVRMIVSAYTDVDDMIAGINDAGIYQFVLKPWHPEALLLAVRGAARMHDLQLQTHALNLELRTAEPVLAQQVRGRRAEARRRGQLDRIRRASGSPLEELCGLVEAVAGYDLPILITGESGTGKELI
ncbi:MAG TPA: response regulator, partial [Pelomicrobium sp.]|nr:response regulator [Pelomicrobium sp.]